MIRGHLIGSNGLVSKDALFHLYAELLEKAYLSDSLFSMTRNLKRSVTGAGDVSKMAIRLAYRSDSVFNTLSDK